MDERGGRAAYKFGQKVKLKVSILSCGGTLSSNRPEVKLGVILVTNQGYGANSKRKLNEVGWSAI